VSSTQPAAWPADPAERDAIAGEYVLGTLDARLARRVAEAMTTDPAMAAAVEHWETMLAPLTSLALPEAPPPDSWDRIESRINPQRTPVAAPAPRSWFWRGWALGASLVAARPAAFTLMPHAPSDRVMTVLISDPNSPALMADVDAKGALRLETVAAFTGKQLQAPSGHSMQLWGVMPGAKEPASLGVMPDEPGRVITIPTSVVRPVSGMLIEISLEPPGGSPTGKPTGPVLFYGRLTRAGPDT
jgi:anti-sigma-K factor RskA